jgi:hypothetical protein
MDKLGQEIKDKQKSNISLTKLLQKSKETKLPQTETKAVQTSTDVNLIRIQEVELSARFH